MALTGSLVVGPDRNGRTIAIVDGIVATRAPDETPALRCSDGEIVPGAVCAHTHMYSGLVPYGMPQPAPPPENFLEILGKVWWRLDKAIDAQSLEASARDYIARALLAGTTTLVDHHESPNMIDGSLAILGDACATLGIRAVLCYGATERNFGREEAVRGLAECCKVQASPLLRGLIGLHAIFTVSDDTVREAGDLARDFGTVLHVHVAEDMADVADAQARGSAGPLERLLSLGALVPGSILAHGVHLSADQVRAADAHRCWFVHNPRSNEGNRVGYARMLSHSTRVALGTDGWNADMAEEDSALARLAGQNGDAGFSGRLAAGHRLVAERFDTHPEPLAPGAVGDLVVRTNGEIRHVVVGGRPVVCDGRLVNGNLDTIAEAARTQASRLWTRMATI